MSSESGQRKFIPDADTWQHQKKVRGRTSERNGHEKKKETKGQSTMSRRWEPERSRRKRVKWDGQSNGTPPRKKSQRVGKLGQTRRGSNTDRWRNLKKSPQGKEKKKGGVQSGNQQKKS